MVQETVRDPAGSQAKVAGEFLLAAFLVLFAAFVIEESIRMPQRGHLGIMMSPGFVPLLTGVMLFGLTLCLLVRSIRQGGPAGLGLFFHQVLGDEENRRLLVILGLVGIYIVVLIGNLNFILATLIFHLTIFFYLKVGGYLKVCFWAVVATALVSVLLPRLFEMPLP